MNTALFLYTVVPTDFGDMVIQYQSNPFQLKTIGLPGRSSETLMRSFGNACEESASPTPEMRARNCSFIIADTYKKLPINRPRFVGPLPEIIGLLPTDNFQAYIDRKLYLHNCGHAILGYLGYLRGHEFTHIALKDPNIRRVLEAAFAETKASFETVRTEHSFEHRCFGLCCVSVVHDVGGYRVVAFVLHSVYAKVDGRFS